MTLPAPPNDPLADDDASLGPPTRRVVTAAEDEGGNVPDARPTTVPTYDVEALAAAPAREPQPQRPHEARSQVLLDLAVPIRKRASLDGAPLRAAFLLLHVDDRMSVAEIALTAQIPLAEAIESFVLLADLGVVELRSAANQRSALGPEPTDTATRRPPPSKSGLRPKT